METNYYDLLKSILEELRSINKVLCNNKEYLSKEQASIYLNMSRATFDRRVAAGIIPRGIKRVGWKELCWNRDVLDKLIPHTT